MTQDLEYLKPYIEKLQNTAFYEITAIRSILDQINETSPAIEKWKEEVNEAANMCNEEAYNRLVISD